ncbi:MAG: hypothetical protein GY847_30190 [Proteobacteria bacterium]|nr:hypothetical protein [Pseudomonadota bacterium]
MDIPGREPPPLPLIAAVVPPLFFYVLTNLARPPWPGIDPTGFGYGILSFSLAIPLMILSVPDIPGRSRRWVALVIASFASVFLCFHAGLSANLVFDMDVGTGPNKETIKAIVGIFLAVFVIPAGLLSILGFGRKKMTVYIFVSTLAGAVSQLAWFGIIRFIEGPGGIEFWLLSRVLIHTSIGLVAGVLAGGARLYRPVAYYSTWGGLSELILGRLPHALPFCILVTLGLFAAGSARIAAEHADSGRFITMRFDDYFLSMSNLHRARSAGLVYQGLLDDLNRSRRALLGAAYFDRELAELMVPMLREIEKKSTLEAKRGAFKRSTLAVNRRLLAVGEPFFLEPHTINEKGNTLNFLLRYTVSGRTRLKLMNGSSVPMLRLRRLDDILIDTPYTGLSYKGIGTILMDHIDDVALRSYGCLFAPGATEQNPNDGGFAVTRGLIRYDRREALAHALSQRGLNDDKALERIAALSQRWSQVTDISGVRAEMDTATLAAYDALAEILARQTEIHEARHAFDGEWEGIVLELEELSAKNLSRHAASEIRAYLTEMIDGHLGPKFALSTVCKMIAGQNARANAYFFAAVAILEGMWGEKIRRPDVVERESPNGPIQMVAPITVKNPGWLSYSRIHGAYTDLRNLPSKELKQRAQFLFERLFNEEYKNISRHR